MRSDLVASMSTGWRTNLELFSVGCNGWGRNEWTACFGVFFHGFKGGKTKTDESFHFERDFDVFQSEGLTEFW